MINIKFSINNIPVFFIHLPLKKETTFKITIKMKKFFSILTIIACAFAMISCSQSKDQTIANLKSAINGEATASAKYAAFAERASQDSLSAIATLFQATAEAESIHVKNHQAVLAELGINDYSPVVDEFQVDSTAANLAAAIKGETEESGKMYPGYIEAAEKEKVQNAILSFTNARDAEKKHAELYTAALNAIATPDSLATIYYICPTCGNVYANEAPANCELCQAPSSSFIVKGEAKPVAQPAVEPEATDKTAATDKNVKPEKKEVKK